MALNDVTFLDAAQFSNIGSRKYKVAASATTIKAGEPVSKTVTFVSGANLSTAVIPAIDGSWNVGTTYAVGIAATTSTNTSTAAGTVEVIPAVPGVVYLCSPLTSSLFDTQAEYDALVGRRVCFDLTSSTYTIDTTTGNNGNGLVIEPLDISKHPGKVAFSIRQQVLYNN
jgi:hypothetical protein